MLQNKAFDQGLYCLLTGISIKNKMKVEKYTRHPLSKKWTWQINKDGIVH